MDGKQLARRIFLNTLAALDVSDSISRCVSCTGHVLRCGDTDYDLNRLSDLRIVVIGKAAHGMLDGLLAVLPARIEVNGIVSAPIPALHPHPGMRYFVAGHPTPNAQSLVSGEAALDLLRGCTAHTFVIVLLSGGGSALFELPLLRALSLADVQQLNRVLVTCGASITEINAVRKHVSAVKGGRLAQAAAPASVLTLAISDVPEGKESALASGPTLPDPTTREDVSTILAKYRLFERLPRLLMDWIASRDMPETPKPNDAAFRRAQYQLVLGMHELFHAAHRIAESLDCLAFCDNSTDDWPVEKAVDSLLTQLAELHATNPRRPVALIADGELSSAVTGNGMGGRNSAFLLACVERIAGKGISVLSAGTDGIDGNSPAAGAVADGKTLQRARATGLDPADFYLRSDSFRFFEALGDAVITGPTGNNLRDMRVLIAFPDR
jgi:hydroxypyruvate reductase